MGETICIFYNNKEFRLKVVEVKPPHTTKAVSIIETDVVLDFAPPPGMEDEGFC